VGLPAELEPTTQVPFDCACTTCATLRPAVNAAAIDVTTTNINIFSRGNTGYIKKTGYECHFWVPEMEFVYTLFILY